MELIYLLIEDCYRLGSHKEIKFSGEFNFNITEYLKAERKITLNITDNENHLVNYFEGNVCNITGIIGGNGVGKTTLLEFLRRLLTNNSFPGDKWLAVFKYNGQFVIVHTLYDPLEEKNTNRKFYENEWSVLGNYNGIVIVPEMLIKWGIDSRFAKLQENENLKSTRLIYYSGIFDLKGFPYNTDPPYIDLSTNFLIDEDSVDEENTLPAKSILLRHKHKNILRQFKLLEINKHLIELDLPAPTVVNIIFELAEYDASESRDLSIGSKRLFEYFRKRIGGEEFNRVNHEIEENRYKNVKEYSAALKTKTKLRFVDALIYNFIKNLDTSDYLHFDLGIEIDPIKDLDIFSATLYFFEHQKWTKSSKFKIVDFIKHTFEMIDDPNNKTRNEHNNNTLTTSNKVSVTELLSNYEWYIQSLPVSRKEGFINVEWRDLSSGQKAIVDLYSRLLYAKQIILEKNAKEKEKAEKSINYVYILLDEAEIGYHPEWQREYLKKIELFLSYLFMGSEKSLFFNTKIQIILASHSPFLASDLPKSNIVFLEKGETDLFKVKSIDHEQTLGANIHTLLSDSFFMHKGLIGLKVESKLYEIIDLLSAKTDQLKAIERRVEIENFILNYGEPLIKQRLESMFEKKLGINLSVNIEERYSVLVKELERIEAIRNKPNDTNQ